MYGLYVCTAVCMYVCMYVCMCCTMVELFVHHRHMAVTVRSRTSMIHYCLFMIFKVQTLFSKNTIKQGRSSRSTQHRQC
jgi:hypothetical protein